MWQDEASHLTLDQTNSVGKRKREGGGGGGGGRKRKEREERKKREKLQLLSMIYGDRWVGFRRAKN